MVYGFVKVGYPRSESFLKHPPFPQQRLSSQGTNNHFPIAYNWLATSFPNPVGMTGKIDMPLGPLLA